MRAEELRDLLRKRPFVPLRLYITSGEHVDIAHPDLAIVTKSLVVVGTKAKDHVAGGLAMYNLLHVVKIEHLNGNRRSSTKS